MIQVAQRLDLAVNVFRGGVPGSFRNTPIEVRVICRRNFLYAVFHCLVLHVR